MGVLGSSVGCAEERDPINRVQAGAVPKTFFLGANLEDYKDDPEFRTKSFNIDSAANTDNYSGTIGGASAVDRVRWEVTENFLFARRSYQEAPGADNKGLPRVEVSPGKWEFPTPATGTIIAAYRITSHFDIRRGYNPQTGEEQNTIEENVSDRPWQKREYMRVDWSKNLAQSTSGDTTWVFGEGTSANAIEYNASNESNSEDRPHFEVTDGYFDITNKYTITPEIIPSFGVPECVIVGFFNGTSSFDCTPTEVKVRHSFVKLTGKEDFEPFEESRAQRDIVGNWGNAGNSFNREYGAPPITAWDPQYGYTDAKTKTFYSVHNIWEKSHQDVKCSSNEDADRDGTADDCSADITKYAGASGSQCDTIIGKCTIPVRDRPVKTIGYWLNADAPQDLTDQLSDDGKTVMAQGAYEELTETWSQLLKVSVAYRREVECRRTGDGSREECHAQYFEGTGPESKHMLKFGGWMVEKTIPQPVDVDPVSKKDRPLVTTCHNPVRAYDEPMCGKPGEVIRLGDVRKNYAIYWPYASRAPYGGVGSIGADPLTGEMVGVTATTMMRSATIAAAHQRDIIALAMGDLQMEELIAGVQASRYADRVKNGVVADAMMKPMSASEIAKAIKNVDLPSIQAAIGESPAALARMPAKERQIRAALLTADSSPQAPGVAIADARLKALTAQLDGSPEMREISNRSLNRLVAQSQDKSTSVFNAISTMAKMDPSRIQEMFQQYQAYLGHKGICFHDSINTSAPGSIYLPSLAPYFKKLYGDLDPVERGVRIYKDLLRESTKGIAFHEIGHSIGLRHNFASSWDSMNYPPQYWQLRTNEKGPNDVKLCGTEGATQDCMGPRYVDPITDDEAGRGSEPRPGIEYFANTSTMEYQIERGGETIGAGTYDLHAMKTLYGRVLETFDPKVVPDGQFFAVKMLSQGISSDLVFDPEKGYGQHYTRAAITGKVFDPKRDCRPATDEEKAIAKWRLVHGKVCSPAPKNHLAYEDMKSDEIAFKLESRTAKVGVSGVRWHGKDETGKDLVRWPYRYGEDYSSGGYLHAKPFDSGADIYEITQNVINRYENQYPWSYFRRQNREFAWWSLSYGVASSTFARIRGYHWTTTTNIGRASQASLEDDDFEKPSVLAAKVMFDFLQRAILTPEPGAYGASNLRTPTRPGAQPILDLAEDSADGIGGVGTLGIVDGRFVQVDFDNDRGGSWDYFHYPTHTGFDEEKIFAIRELVDSRPTLSTVSRENALDGRDPYISFRTDTPWAIDRLVGAILSEDWETIGPSLNADAASHTVFSVVPRNAADLTRPADHKGILFPNMGYTNELGTAIYAMLFSRFSTDMVLAQKMRIHFDGDNNPIPADRQIVFRDPVTGYRYVAARFGTENIGGRAVETGIASRMLQRANELLADAYSGVGAPDPVTGERETALTNGQPVAKDPTAEAALRRYIGLLDGMRQIRNLLGGGPIGYGDGD